MSDPIEILERRLRAVLDRDASTQSLHFFFQLGGFDDDLGIITLQVSGSGNLLLSWRTSPDDVELWTLQFTDADYDQFIRLFLSYPFWKHAPARRGREEGETNIHLRISAQDVGTYQGAQFWSGDLEQSRTLRTLVTPLCKLIINISRDEISPDELAHLMIS